MKKILFILCIFNFSILIYAQDTNGIHYFPLKVGNRWVYRSYSSVPPGTTNFLKISVLRDSIIDGKRCFIFNQSLPIPNQYVPPSDKLYLDSSNGNLFTYETGWCTSPFIIVDSLSSSLNDTFRQCPTHNLYDIRKCYETGIKNFMGNNLPYKRFDKVNHTFHYICEYIYNIGYSYGYSNDLYPNWYRTYTLLGCVIDGVLYGDTNIVGLKRISELTPDKYKLLQNYPNPFNPATKIKFDIPPSKGVGLPAAGRGMTVQLVIYDILGREIATLVNEQLKPGTYEVEWDGSNYPSGVYFYKLITQNYSETKKMVLIK
jgi:hypothetical protein